MYKTMEDRVAYLEKEMQRQAFQIKLLHAVIRNREKAGIYEFIVQMNLSEVSFYSLKRLTNQYEDQLKEGFSPTLSNFIQDVQSVFEQNFEVIHFTDLSNFIPRWLGGVAGGSGFSSALHRHFYGK